MDQANFLAVLALLLLEAAVLLSSGVDASYRHFHLVNADICSSRKLLGGDDESNKPLVIGSGAAIIQLQSPSRKFQPDYNRAKRCEIHIKSPDKEHGLMAYVEEMNMRRSSRDPDKCIDYVQFGQDDIVPFITMKKSQRYCGGWNGRASISGGIVFDEPGGDLLVWVSLGGRRASSWWPHIEAVNLTLVVTTYQKDCKKPKQNYRRCGDRSRCVYQHYFCDRHFNCLTDKIPLDEDGCTYEVKTTEAPGGRGNAGSGFETGSGLNSVTKTLVIVCSTLGVLLLLILWLRYRKSKRCCGGGGPLGSLGGSEEDETCEMRHHQGGPRSLEELNRLRQLRQQNEENLYQPTVSSGGGGGRGRGRGQEGMSYVVDPSRGLIDPRVEFRGRGRGEEEGGGAPPDLLPSQDRPPEEPPPAYDELFPGREGGGDGGGGTEPTPTSAAEDVQDGDGGGNGGGGDGEGDGGGGD